LRGKGENYLYGELLIASLFALIYSGCGISTTAYLYPPASLVVSGSQITVQNDGANYEPSEGSNQTFLGIDIYYRIFQNSSVAESRRNQLSSWSAMYDGNPDSFISSAESAGFRVMRKTSTSSRPTIALADASDESLHTIITSTWILDGGVQVVRDGYTSPKRDFSEKIFSSTDQDYEGADSSGVGTFYIVLFVVSYGEDTIGAAVYSDPVVATSILEF